MSLQFDSAAKAAKDVILSDSNTYYQWYENIRGSVPNHLWRYFDPDGEAIFVEPVPPIEPVDEPPPTITASGSAAHGTRASRAPTETPEQRTARQSLFKEQMEMYFKRHAIYRDTLRQWEKYNECEAKLRERILATVVQQKAAPLVSHNSVRKWLSDLKASTQPPKALIKQNIRVEYQKLMSVGLLEWPTNGPSGWLAKWEDLIYRAKQYEEPLPNWLGDISMVWQRVPDLLVYFKNIELDIQKEEVDKYSYASVSSTIQQHWERKKQGLTLRFAKPKSTRSAFSMQEVSFNGEEEPPLSPTFDNDKSMAKNTKRKQNPAAKPNLSRRKRQNISHNRDRSQSPKSDNRKQTERDLCIACDGARHSFKSCYLVKGNDKNWISQKARRVFEENMKIPAFKKKVDDLRREAHAVQ